MRHRKPSNRIALVVISSGVLRARSHPPTREDDAGLLAGYVVIGLAVVR
jgi:hypothetical protein